MAVSPTYTGRARSFPAGPGDHEARAWRSVIATCPWKDSKRPETDANARFNELGPAYFRTLVISRMAAGGDDELDIEIVGVVRDAKYSEVKGARFALAGFIPAQRAARVDPIRALRHE